MGLFLENSSLHTHRHISCVRVVGYHFMACIPHKGRQPVNYIRFLSRFGIVVFCLLRVNFIGSHFMWAKFVVCTRPYIVWNPAHTGDEFVGSQNKSLSSGHREAGKFYVFFSPQGGEINLIHCSISQWWEKAEVVPLILHVSFSCISQGNIHVLLLDRIKQFWFISILFLRLISLKILLLRMSLCCRQSYKKSGIGVHQYTSELGMWFKTQKNIFILSPMSTTGRGWNGV